MKWRATACSKFSTFFEKAFVNRVMRRIPTRIVRLLRSQIEVETCSYFGGAPDDRWNDDILHQLTRVKGKDLEVVKLGDVVTR